MYIPLGVLSKTFSHPVFGNLRVIVPDETTGEPWFVARDVANALALTNISQTLAALDADEKGITISDTLGGKQRTITVSEPGLYSLVLRSRKPEARQFKRWITHEVLPTIRKHGFYGTPATLEAMISDPSTAIGLLTALKDTFIK